MSLRGVFWVSLACLRSFDLFSFVFRGVVFFLVFRCVWGVWGLWGVLGVLGCLFFWVLGGFWVFKCLVLLDSDEELGAKPAKFRDLITTDHLVLRVRSFASTKFRGESYTSGCT